MTFIRFGRISNGSPTNTLEMVNAMQQMFKQRLCDYADDSRLYVAIQAYCTVYIYSNNVYFVFFVGTERKSWLSWISREYIPIISNSVNLVSCRLGFFSPAAPANCCCSVFDSDRFCFFVDPPRGRYTVNKTSAYPQCQQLLWHASEATALQKLFFQMFWL